MKRVLFVDDDQRILDGLQRTLRPHRHEWDMVFLPDGEAALAELERQPCDVIVADLRMPRMDGATLLGHVRDRFPQTVRIVLSGHPEREAALRVVPVAHQFLIKPCDATTLRHVIERACALQAILGSPTLRQIVGEMGALPSSPRLYTALTAVLADPDVSLTEVARIVEQDVAMTAKCLQLVNSAFFGLVRRITTIREAVAYLGTSVLRNLVFSTESFRVFQTDLRMRGFSMTQLEQHASLTAGIALGLMKGQPQANEAFLAAMLHDIGKLVLASHMRDRFAQLTSAAIDQQRPLHVIEADVLGVTHAEIGAYLLGLWGVPYTIVEAVAYHHQPQRVDQPAFDLSAAIYVANVLAHELGLAAPGAFRQPRVTLDEDYLETIGVRARLPEWRQMARSISAA